MDDASSIEDGPLASLSSSSLFASLNTPHINQNLEPVSQLESCAPHLLLASVPRFHLPLM